MTCLYALILLLAWLTPAAAGTIRFDLDLQGTRCTVTHRGDSTAYYPEIHQMDRWGRWQRRGADNSPAELMPGATLTVEIAPVAKADADAIDTLLPMLVKFYDQSGVGFGQISLLRPPPESTSQLEAGYTGSRLRLSPPTDGKQVRSTWVLAPREDGVAPIAAPLDREFRQPQATRIDWTGRGPVAVETGAARPSALLVHETPAGFALQKVGKPAAPPEQRAPWLNLQGPCYALGGLCLLCGIFLSLRTEKRLSTDPEQTP